MPQYRWFLRPVSIFIFSLIALGASLYIYIRSYLNVNEAFEKFLVTYNVDTNQFARPETWVTILTLSILVAIILVGLILILITYQRGVDLYRMQQNFISGFTHELKTPIASIRLYVDTFLQHDLAPEQQRKYLKYMLEDTDRLSTNVEQILSLGKLEERNYQANFEQADLKTVLRKLVNELSHRHTNGKIILNEDGFDGAMANIDISLFQVLMSNVINNGMYHNLSKEPQVNISGEIKKDGLHIIVKDNGVGVDPKFEKKIFKKFFQIGKSVKGSGLGLYMCQIIARFHQIKFNVKGLGQNKGTIISVILPSKSVHLDVND